MGNKKANFQRQAMQTGRTYDYYYNRLKNIAMSIFEWHNLPETVDQRFMEQTIFERGLSLFFEDPVLGCLALPAKVSMPLNVYNIPQNREAYSSSGYTARRTGENSVIIYHNYTHDVPAWDIQMFAQRLTDMQRTIDMNVYAQRTPVAVLCDENKRLTYQNIMLNYDGFTPLIFGNDNLDLKAITALKIDAPFIADKVEELKTMLWNDAMTYLGISNVNVTKKERLITDEVQRNMGGTLASRYSPLEMRREAAKKINDMFGLNVEVDFREDILAYESSIIGGTEENIMGGGEDE